MNEEMMQKMIEKAVTKTVEKRLASIIKQQNQNIQTGQILSFNKGGHTARVRVMDGVITVPYPSIYDSVIQDGLRVLLVSGDPKNQRRKFIIGIY